MKTENELKISVEDFKLIKHFYPEFTRKADINSNEFVIGWSELMPVVEKISKIRCAPDSDVDYDTYFPRTFGMLSPEARKPMVRINRNPVYEADTLIEATFQAAVDFIKIYNSKNS